MSRKENDSWIKKSITQAGRLNLLLYEQDDIHNLFKDT